jgi:hypothetical protein
MLLKFTTAALMTTVLGAALSLYPNNKPKTLDVVEE